MSNVTLQIGGRPYTVACGEGQEAHIKMLGREIDAKLKALDGNPGQNEQRALLFAALLLADEVHELKQDRAPAAAAPPPPPPPPAIGPDEVIGLEALANHLENLADSLESGASGH